jgi:hypothetical protein
MGIFIDPPYFCYNSADEGLTRQCPRLRTWDPIIDSSQNFGTCAVGCCSIEINRLTASTFFCCGRYLRHSRICWLYPLNLIPFLGFKQPISSMNSGRRGPVMKASTARLSETSLVEFLMTL